MDEAVTEIAQMKSRLDDLIKKQKDLDTTTEEGKIEYQEYASIIRVLKKEQSDMARAVDNSVRSFKAAEGSIVSMRAELSNLTQKYNQLSKEERDNIEVGGKLQAQIKSISDELKKNEGAIGDNRRSVGDYKKSILDAADNISIFGVNVGSLKKKFELAKDGIKTAQSGFSSFNGLIKASAIGVLILLIGGVIAAFTKFQPLVDKITATFAGINAVVDVFIQRLIRVGQGLVAILSGNVAAGIEQIRTSFDGMAEDMKKAGKEAYDLAEALDALADKQRAQIILNAEAEKEVNKLILQSKNRRLSEEQRLALLDKASKIERQNFEENKKLSIESYNIALNQAKLKTQLSKQEIEELLTNTDKRAELEKKMGTLTDDELTKLAEQKAGIIKLEEESVAVQEKIVNRRGALITELETQRQKELDDALKADDDRQKKIKEGEDKILKDREDAYKKASQINDRAYKRGQADLNAQLESQKITQEEYDKLTLENTLKFQEEQLKTNQQFYQETVDLELQVSQTKLNIAKDETDKKKKLSEAQIKSAIDVANAAQGIVQELANAADKGTAIQKVAALSSVAISLGTSIANLTATTSSPLSADNLVTGGAAGFLKYAAFITQILSSVNQAREIIGGAAAGGGTFYTKGPTLMMVGDNPTGRERVTVEPIGAKGKTWVNPNSNLVAMAGGGTLIADGGASLSRATQDTNRMFGMNSLFKNMPAPIVKVTDIERVNNNRSKSVKVSQLS
jgi:hypothetical protein